MTAVATRLGVAAGQHTRPGLFGQLPYVIGEQLGGGVGEFYPRRFDADFPAHLRAPVLDTWEQAMADQQQAWDAWPGWARPPPPLARLDQWAVHELPDYGTITYEVLHPAPPGNGVQLGTVGEMRIMRRYAPFQVAWRPTLVSVPGHPWNGGWATSHACQHAHLAGMLHIAANRGVNDLVACGADSVQFSDQSLSLIHI